MFINYLQTSINVGYITDVKKVVFQHTYAGNWIAEISDWCQLQYAVKVLRAHGKVEIVFLL